MAEEHCQREYVLYSRSKGYYLPLKKEELLNILIWQLMGKLTTKIILLLTMPRTS